MIDFAGIKFKNPFVIASGPITSKVELLKKAEKHGAIAASIKLTIDEQSFRGKLRTYSMPGHVIISPIDSRLDVSEGLKLVKDAKRSTSLILFANMASSGIDVNGWVELAKKFEKAGADILELNFCCPNIGLAISELDGKIEDKSRKIGAVTGEDPELCSRIVRAIKDKVKIPVVCKIIPGKVDLITLAKSCEKAGIDGLHVVGEPILGLPPVDIYADGKPLIPLLDGVSYGSTNGPVCKYNTYMVISQLARHTKLPLIGSGGLETWQDAINMIMWGAKLVSACSVIMWKGFETIEGVNKGIQKFMEEKGYNSYDDFRGQSLKYLTSPDKVRVIEGAAVVDPVICTGCGICLKPGHCIAIRINKGKAIVNENDCIGCGICVNLCPHAAIKI